MLVSAAYMNYLYDDDDVILFYPSEDGHKNEDVIVEHSFMICRICILCNIHTQFKPEYRIQNTGTDQLKLHKGHVALPWYFIPDDLSPNQNGIIDSKLYSYSLSYIRE